ncbi:MAG: alpha/beta hydrolase [Phormidesmis sp.]
MNLHYKKTGAGLPLVLVHGALADLRMWNRVQSILSLSYEVVSFSQRYFGRSTDVERKDFGYQTHAEDLVNFLSTEVKQPCHIVAWSYGADVALLAAKIEPRYFKSIFLYELGRGTHLGADDLTTYNRDVAEVFGKLGEIVEKEKTESGAAALMDATANRIGYFSSQRHFDQIIQLENAHTLPMQLNQSASEGVRCVDIADMTFPMCFARGDRTRNLFKIATDSAYACSLQGTHRVVADATHMLPIERPDVFSREVEAFLNFETRVTESSQ